MPIYDKPVWRLMWDMVEELGIKEGKVFSKDQVLAWFARRYPKIKKDTISAHLIRQSTNAPSRIHHHGKPGDDDLLFQIDGSHFRLYNPQSDPPPIYGDLGQPETPDLVPVEEPEPPAEFAYETDLRNFLSKNLFLLEPGLQLYEDEDITGIEFPAGGRLIDILAIDAEQNYVVIELKVSRGYDRVVGQLLRYMGWVAKNLAEPSQKVRGFIVAREIAEDLLLACLGVPNVELFEYELSVTLRRVKGHI